MDEFPRSPVRRASSYVLEATAAIALIYFFLGGAGWSPWMWALFGVFAVSVVVHNVLHDTGRESEADYEKWRARLGLAMVVAILAAAVWHRSVWTLGLGLVLGWIWIDERRIRSK